ncbi:MAG: flagellar basal body rod protein FlgB [Deltaproteobacteria bacterium]|nr:flagellar basal body rod protein FlgB [Deltaproteobacteria bacterium]
MKDLGIFDGTMKALQTALDFRVANQKTISSNIANLDTPGYVPVKLEFEQDLNRAMQSGVKLAKTNSSHLGSEGELDGISARVVRTPSRAGIGDQNEVNLDEEMIRMAENQIHFEAVIQALNKKISLLKYVAQDGR